MIHKNHAPATIATTPNMLAEVDNAPAREATPPPNRIHAPLTATHTHVAPAAGHHDHIPLILDLPQYTEKRVEALAARASRAGVWRL